MSIKTKHKLEDIIIITICAANCGANDWVVVETYGKAKHDWLKTLNAWQCGIEVEGGILPSKNWFLNLQILASGGFQ